MHSDQENSMMKKPPFEGVWSLISYVARSTSGEESLPFGEEPMGRLIYTPTGHVSATLCRMPRHLVASDEKSVRMDAEFHMTSDWFDAYAGIYEIDVAANQVVHRVALSSRPNMIGTDQIRYFKFENNDHLVLSTPPIISCGHELVLKLVWWRLA
ncbi:lipocalin-like domain-containing protein [Xanthomonas sp. NCPPB 1325]|uniref:lipocalin-like domain-containing protein n=1 Tax=Xanthomonas sp. NCPPB 1325 TaxID=487529 RepID=UPI0035571A7C